ncbi:MAG: hypothetical protein L3J96_07535 [Thermoplasmata archaeon]|nr:hypothetical protein [Thermoplasmata archaeon]
MTPATRSVRLSTLSSPGSHRRRLATASTLRATAFRTAIEESLGLFIVGGVCCFLGVYYISSGARFGSSRLPIWELFVALGIVGLVGGFLSMAAEEDADGTRPRALGRPTPHVVLDEPELEAVPSDRPEASPSPQPSPEPSGEIEPGPDPSYSSEEPILRDRYDPDVATSVEDALAELDGVERSLGEGPRVRVVDRPDRALRPAGASNFTPRSSSLSGGGIRASPTTAVAAPPAMGAPPRTAGECGGCGREPLGSNGSECPGCGSRLCQACWEGFDPPPCPSCADLRSPR